MRREREDSATGHGVTSVDAQVQNRLLQLAGIPLDGRQAAGQLRPDLD
jgi:hypothetical protein